MKCTVPTSVQGFPACWKGRSVSWARAAGDGDLVGKMQWALCSVVPISKAYCLLEGTLVHSALQGWLFLLMPMTVCHRIPECLHSWVDGYICCFLWEFVWMYNTDGTFCPYSGKSCTRNLGLVRTGDYMRRLWPYLLVWKYSCVACSVSAFESCVYKRDGCWVLGTCRCMGGASYSLCIMLILANQLCLSSLLSLHAFSFAWITKVFSPVLRKMWPYWQSLDSCFCTCQCLVPNSSLKIYTLINTEIIPPLHTHALPLPPPHPPPPSVSLRPS